MNTPITAMIPAGINAGRRSSVRPGSTYTRANVSAMPRNMMPTATSPLILSLRPTNAATLNSDPAGMIAHQNSGFRA